MSNFKNFRGSPRAPTSIDPQLCYHNIKVSFFAFSSHYSTVYMLQLNTRNDRKQVKNSAKVGVSNVKISSASEGLRPPDSLTRGFAPGPHWGTAPRPPYGLALPRSP